MNRGKKTLERGFRSNPVSVGGRGNTVSEKGSLILFCSQVHGGDCVGGGNGKKIENYGKMRKLCANYVVNFEFKKTSQKFDLRERKNPPYAGVKQENANRITHHPLMGVQQVEPYFPLLSVCDE